LGLKTDDNKTELERIDARFNAIDNYEVEDDVDIWYSNWVDELEDWIDLFIALVKDWTLGVGGIIEVQGQKVLQ
jgi:hypothetical protein